MPASNTLVAALNQFSSTTRLLAIEIRDVAQEFIVEAFSAFECVHEIGVRDVIVLATRSGLDTRQVLSRPATLLVSLSDGTRTRFSGLINEVEEIGSDGALTRYRLRMVPWLWLLTQSSTSRVWQDKTVLEVVESLFQDFPQHAAWQWSSEAARFLAEVRPRSFVAMYRETYFDFLVRLLAEEGLSFRIEEAENTPHGHQVLLFA
ncbi:MAG: type VI secretion system Vgr family protein, partial [Pseudomonadota bacterium]|nr:type VI secretion system Vgr family protein [Pseudomonadota bacterium]